MRRVVEDRASPFDAGDPTSNQRAVELEIQVNPKTKTKTKKTRLTQKKNLHRTIEAMDPNHRKNEPFPEQCIVSFGKNSSAVPRVYLPTNLNLNREVSLSLAAMLDKSLFAISVCILLMTAIQPYRGMCYHCSAAMKLREDLS